MTTVVLKVLLGVGAKDQVYQQLSTLLRAVHTVRVQLALHEHWTHYLTRSQWLSDDGLNCLALIISEAKPNTKTQAIENRRRTQGSHEDRHQHAEERKQKHDDNRDQRLERQPQKKQANKTQSRKPSRTQHSKIRRSILKQVSNKRKRNHNGDPVRKST